MGQKVYPRFPSWLGLLRICGFSLVRSLRGQRLWIDYALHSISSCTRISPLRSLSKLSVGRSFL